MKLFPSPNMMAKPNIQKAMDESPKTTKFFPRILTAFLPRQNPASTQPNPAFIQKTRKAVTRTQMVSTATFSSAPPSCAQAGQHNNSPNSNRNVPRIFISSLLVGFSRHPSPPR